MTADFDEAGCMAHARIAVRVVKQRSTVVERELSLDDDAIANAQRRRLAHRNIVCHVERQVRAIRAHVDDEPLVKATWAVAIGKYAHDRSLDDFFGSRAVSSYVC
jgi:hypothetical protein